MGKETAEALNTEQSPTDFSALIAKIEPKRGDIGCFLIYRCIEGHDIKIGDFLKRTPHFVRRKSVDKGSGK